MVIRRKVLTPVKREDFVLDISRHAEIKPHLNPTTYFDPVISAFKKFAVGSHFWFIPNLIQGGLQDAGGMTQEIIGIALDDFIKGGPEQLFGCAHPEDISQIFAFTNSWIAFFQSIPLNNKNFVHPTIYARLRNQQGIFKWTMIQYADHIFDEGGNILYALTMVTDISHIKKEGPAMMSILDTTNESCQHFFCTDNNNSIEQRKSVPALTNREVEVLGYMAIGYSSKQIAAELDVATKTVENHRQSMLKKTESKSSSELVSFAIKAGYI